MAKKHVNQMKSYLRTADEEKARIWCIRNGIYISPFADNPSEWWIDITIKDRNSRSPKKYTGKEIWPKVYELYKFYYDKHRRSV